MRVLVTGGTGFIGTHLVNRLVELGHDVTVMARPSTTKKETLNKNAGFASGDIRDEADVRKTMKGCGAVFHLAALVDARSPDDDAIHKINFIGAKNTFEAAIKNNAKIIFTSTAAVYGNGPVPNKETGPNKPISQYGKSKLLAEKFLSNNAPDSFIARPFNVYGPGSKSAVNRFCKKIANYEDVSVYGNGMQTRDYVYVSDVIEALILGLNNNGIYNVGTGTDISTSSLIDMIFKMTRCKPSIKNEPPIKGEIARSRADITKIRQLGWSPRVDLETGIWNVLDSIGYKKLV